MSMAPTTEPQSPPSDLGQRLFLLGVFAVLVAEVIVTVANVGQWFEWTSCLLGVIACLGMLYLGNWLYTGNRTALTVTRIWVAIQLAVVLAGVIALSETPADSAIPRHLGINAFWQGYLKLAVYLGFAGLLFAPGATLDFFSAQRGEAPAKVPAPTTEQTAPVGNPVELAVEHTRALEGLGGAMQTVSGVLVIVGALELLIGLLAAGQTSAADWLSIHGIVVAALGAVLWPPTKALQALLGASPRNTGYVMNFLTALLATFKAYLFILLALAVLVVSQLMLSTK